MFGFLRRKKPVEDAAPPAAAEPAAVESAFVEPTSVEPAPAAIEPTADAPPPSSSEPPAQSARRPGFFSRLFRGETAEPEQPPAPAESAEPASSAEPLPAIAPVASPPMPPAALPEPARLEPARLEPARPEPSRPEPARTAPTRAEPAPEPPMQQAPRPDVQPALRSELEPEPEPEPELVPDSEPEPDRSSWVARLKQGLSRTRGGLGALFVGVKVDEALFDELEAALLAADAGPGATAYLIERLRAVVRRDRLSEGGEVKRALKALVAEMLLPLEQPIDIDRADPLVMMIAGVNGAGKTTSIGKLARHLQREKKTVLLAAGDTFRAAAREQLAEWGARNGVAVVAQQGGDPAAVAFDAVSAARARRIEVVIVDTAGRLPTQLHLMEELKKVRRVLAKAMPDAPHETLLVLDGNTGQNALAQVKAFDDAVPLTGLVVTKLDGTAKGGALIALAHTRRERPVPVYFVGVGEGIEDLQAFSSKEFAEALFD